MTDDDRQQIQWRRYSSTEIFDWKDWGHRLPNAREVMGILRGTFNDGTLEFRIAPKPLLSASAIGEEVERIRSMHMKQAERARAERELWEKVLRAIAEGRVTSTPDTANAALATLEIKFSRS